MTASRSTPRLAVRAASLAWASSWVSATTIVDSGVTVMSLRSRPRSSRWPCSASSLRGRSSKVDVVFSSWAYWAARRKVFFSPCPPIMIGISPVDRGGGVERVAHAEVGAAVRRRRLGEHPAADLQGVGQHLVAHLQRRELEAQRLVLELEPRGTDAQHRPPAGDHVEGGDGLGEVRGVAVGHAGDEGGEADRLGAGGEGAEERVRLEHLLLRLAHHGQLVEVVHHEDGVEAGLLGGDRLGRDPLEQLARRDVRVREVRDLEADVRAVHAWHSRSSKPSMIAESKFSL